LTEDQAARQPLINHCSIVSVLSVGFFKTEDDYTVKNLSFLGGKISAVMNCSIWCS
jgi:hypothetical protein